MASGRVFWTFGDPHGFRGPPIWIDYYVGKVLASSWMIPTVYAEMEPSRD